MVLGKVCMPRHPFGCDTLRGMKLSNLFLLVFVFFLGSEAFSLNLDLPCQSQIDRFMDAYEIDTTNPQKKDGVTIYRRTVEPAEKAAFEAALKKATTVGVPVTSQGFDDVSGPPLYVSGYGTGLSELWNKSARIEEKAGGIVKIKISGYQKWETWVPNPKTKINQRAVKLVYRENERIIDLKKSGSSCYLDGFQQWRTYVSADCCQRIYDKELEVCQGKAKEGDLTKIARGQGVPGNQCITTEGKPEFREEFLRDGVLNCRRYSCKGSKIFASMLPPKSAGQAPKQNNSTSGKARQ